MLTRLDSAKTAVQNLQFGEERSQSYRIWEIDGRGRAGA
jgi:hypothetical protein